MKLGVEFILKWIKDFICNREMMVTDVIFDEYIYYDDDCENYENLF